LFWFEFLPPVRHLRLEPEAFVQRYKHVADVALALSSGHPLDLSPGTIHDLRVSGRRLQTMSRLLPRSIRRSSSARELNSALKGMMKATSSVRDLDTLLATLQAYNISAHSSFITSLARERMRKANKASRAIRTFAGRLDVRVKSRGLDDAKLSRRLEKRIKASGSRVRSSLSVVLRDESNIEELHSLRLEVKTLRYLLELVDPRPRELPAMEGWQEALGGIHDLDVALGYLRGNLRGPSRKERLQDLADSRHRQYVKFLVLCGEHTQQFNQGWILGVV